MNLRTTIQRRVSRLFRTQLSCLGIAAYAIFGISLGLGACEDDEPADVILGTFDGDWGEPCLSYHDCLPTLECVDRVCGIFGQVKPQTSDESGSTGCPGPHDPSTTGSSSSTGSNSDTSSTPSDSTATDSGTLSTSTTSTDSTTSSTSGETTSSSDPTTSSTDDDSTDTTTMPDPCAGVPAMYQKSNPYDRSNAAIVSAGETLYRKDCAVCHGSNGEGVPSLKSPPMNDAAAAASPDCNYLWRTAEGVGTMPPFKDKLTTDEVWKVVTFIRNLQP